MNIAPLLKMLNEIGLFFRSGETSQQVPAAVAAHLRRYWEPRMRKSLVDYHLQHPGALSEFEASVVEALRKLE